MSFEIDRRSGLVESVRRAASWPFRVAAARAAMNALAGMDVRELADIGLTPSDLRDVSALALDRDPTALLGAARARTAARRCSRRRPPAGHDWDRTAMGFCEMGSSSRDFLLPLREKVSPKATNEGRSGPRGA